MTRPWLIGSGPDCDVVVVRPSVSLHHVRLERGEAGEVILEDLGSPFGTFVNGVRLSAPVGVTPGDAVTLGPTTPLPWPQAAIPPGWKILTIGREPDNDFPVNLATVSGYHARIIWNARTGQAILEDLESSNGSALMSLGRRVTREALTAADTVLLGTHPILAADLLARVAAAPVPAPALTFRGREMIIGRDPTCDQVIDLPIVSGRHARLTRSGSLILIDDLGSSNGTYVNDERVERPVAVTPGDQIRLGNHTLTLVVPAASATAPPAPALVGTSPPSRTLWPLLAVAALVPLGAVLYIGIASTRGGHEHKGENRPAALRPATNAPQSPPVAPPELPYEPPAAWVAGPSVPIGTDNIASRNAARPPAPVAPPSPVPSPPKDVEIPQEAFKAPSDQPPEPVLAWANSLDLSNLKPADEFRLGEELHKMVLAHVKPVEEGPYLDRAIDAARRVSNADYTITILDSDAVNAFSFPGGHIYLCRGLFDIIGSDEDYILEFAIGHEIAHLTLNHAMKSVAANCVEARKRGVDTLNQFLLPIALGYRNAPEFEADAWIYRRMIAQPDSTKRTCLAFLRKLRDYADRQKFASGRKPPDSESPLFENHFRAHPAARERLKRLESYSAEATAKPAK